MAKKASSGPLLGWISEKGPFVLQFEPGCTIVSVMPEKMICTDQQGLLYQNFLLH